MFAKTSKGNMKSLHTKIYWCILDLPQHVSASHYHHQGVIVTPEATQAISMKYK
jgi:hypothetical protein